MNNVPGPVYVVNKRELMHSITVTIVIRDPFWLTKIGLWCIRFGCWLSGINYMEKIEKVEEVDEKVQPE